MDMVARSEKTYVKTFLFSMKTDSFLSRVHLITKFIFVLLVSLVLVRFMDMTSPDPVGALLLLIISILLHYFAGTLQWVFKTYLVLVFLMLLTLFINWVVFNPDLGSAVFYQAEVYHGYIPLGISLALIAFVAVFYFSYRLYKSFFYSTVFSLLAVALLKTLKLNLSWTFVQIPFFHSLSIYITDKNLLVAATKVLGYGAMVFLTLMLVMTIREHEFVGFLRQLGMPFKGSFFFSLALRSLSTAMIDYETIVQAQIAKGINLERRTVFQKFQDFAYLAVPLVATMFRRANEIGPSLLARGIGNVRKPTEYMEVCRFTAADWAIVTLTVLATLAVYGLQINFTRMLGLWGGII